MSKYLRILTLEDFSNDADEFADFTQFRSGSNVQSSTVAATSLPISQTMPSLAAQPLQVAIMNLH